MKKFLLLASLLPLAGPAALAQKTTEKQVPAATVATFKKAHPTAKVVAWEKEGTNYEAGFTEGKSEMSVVITPTGKLLETETAMPVSQLPAGVRTKLATTYKGYKVLEAAKIVAAATGATTYEAEMSQAGKQQDVLFYADGTEVKK